MPTTRPAYEKELERGRARLKGWPSQLFDAVIFDMDGTLIDSTPAIVRAWTTWAIEFGVTASQLAGQHGKPTASVVRELIAPRDHAAAMTRINELELADVGDIVVLPGAADALASLDGAACAIATSCTKTLAAVRMEASGLTPPRVLVTVEDVARGKPAPDPYLEAARRLGVDPTRCLVVEDAPAGLTSAKSAGCLALAVVTTTPIDELHADIVTPDLSHIRFSVIDGGQVRVSLRPDDAA